MKKTTTLALTLGLLVAATRAYGQDPTPTDFTVQDLNVALTGFVQGTDDGTTRTVKAVRITTKDLINAVGTTGKAKLIVATPVDDPTAASTFFVRTGTGDNTVNTDVSGFFSGQTYLIVEKSKTSSSGKVSGTPYSIDQFVFGGTGDQGTPVSFNVQGFSTSSLANSSLVSNVNGVGNVNGDDAVLRGTIKFSGGKTETINIP